MTMPEWTVHLDSPPNSGDESTAEALLDRLAADPDALGPSVGLNLKTGSVGATFTVIADDPIEAARIGCHAFGAAASCVPHRVEVEYAEAA